MAQKNGTPIPTGKWNGSGFDISSSSTSSSAQSSSPKTTTGTTAAWTWNGSGFDAPAASPQTYTPPQTTPKIDITKPAGTTAKTTSTATKTTTTPKASTAYNTTRANKDAALKKYENTGDLSADALKEEKADLRVIDGSKSESRLESLENTRDYYDKQADDAFTAYRKAIYAEDTETANKYYNDYRTAKDKRKSYDKMIKDYSKSTRLSWSEKKAAEERLDTVGTRLQTLAANPRGMTAAEQNEYEILSKEYEELASKLGESTRTVFGKKASAVKAGAAGFASGAVETAALSTAGQNQAAIAAAKNPNQYLLENDPEYAALVKQGQEAIAAGQTDWTDSNTNKLYGAADRLAEKQAVYHEEATKGATTFGKVTSDIVENMVQMAGDAVVGRTLGVDPLAVMALRTYGSGAQEARQGGYDQAQQMFYGTLKAGVEAGTEKLFDGFFGVYGKGTADEFTENLIKKLAKESKAGNALLTMVFGALGEANEEAISGLLDPVIGMVLEGTKSFTDAYGTSEGRKKLAADVGYSMLIGGLCGLIGSGGKAANILASKGISVAEQQAIKDEVLAEQQKNGTAPEQLMQNAEAQGEKTIPQTETQTDTAVEQNAKAPTAEEQAVKNLIADGVSNSKADAILADPALRAVAEAAIGQPISGTKSEQRSIIKQNLDVINNYIDGITPVAPITEESNVNADTSNNPEIIANESNVSEGDIQTPPTPVEINTEQNTPQETQTAINETQNVQNEQINQPAEVAKSNENVTQSAQTPMQGQTVAQPQGQNATQDNLGDTKVYTQDRVFESSLTQEEKTIDGLSPEEAKHVRHSDALVAETARAALETDRAAETARLVDENTSWGDVETAEAGMLIHDLIAQARAETDAAKRSEIWEQVATLKKAWNREGTKEGQALRQRQNFISPLSVEDMVSDCAETLQDAKLRKNLGESGRESIIKTVEEFATKFNDISKNDAKGTIELIKELARIRKNTSFFTKDVSNTVDKALNYLAKNENNTQFLRDVAAVQIKSIPGDYIKAGLINQIKALRYINLLSNPATTVSNFGSNTIFGEAINTMANNIALPLDIALSKLTGTRSVAFDRSFASREFIKGSSDAAIKSFLEVTLDAESEQANYAYSEIKGSTFKMTGNIFERYLARVSKWQGYMLKSTDQFQKGGTEAEIARGLEGVNTSSDASVESIAKEEAKYRTLQSDSRTAKQFTTARDWANNLGIPGTDIKLKVGNEQTGEFGLGDALLPFAQVPANSVVSTMQMNPLNVFPNLVNLGKIVVDVAKGKTISTTQQRKVVTGIGRSVNGAMVIALNAALAAKGIIRDSDDEDKDVSALQKAMGHSGMQINASALTRIISGDTAEKPDDVWISMGWMPMLNSVMVMGAGMYESYNEEGKLKFFKNSLDGLFSAFMDFPAVSSITDLVNSWKYSKADTKGGKLADLVATFVGDIVSSVTESNLMRNIAAGIDDKQRDTYLSDSVVEQIYNDLLAGIPGLRESMVPVKLDNFGNEITNEGGLLQFFDAMLIPGNVRRTSNYELANTVMELYDATGDTGVIPDRKAPNSLDIDGEKHKLTADDKQAYQQTSGQTSANLLVEMYDNDFFNGLTDLQKAEAIKEAHTYAKYLAKAEYAEANGLELSDEEKAENIYADLENPAEYMSVKTAWSNLDKTDAKAVDGFIKDMGKLGTENYNLMLERNSDLERYVTGADVGLDAKRVTEIRDKYQEIKGNESYSPTDQATSFANYLYEQTDLNPEQRQAMLDTNKFSSGYAVSAESYENMINAGFSAGKAAELYNAYTNLQPENGAEAVTKAQKYKAISGLDWSTNDKLKALELIGDSPIKKFQTAVDCGMTYDSYCDFYIYLGNLNDAAGSGNASQYRFSQTVKHFGLSYDMANKLWSQVYGWSGNYNPDKNYKH